MSQQLHFSNKFKYKNGYVALMSVMIISAVGAIVAVSVLVAGMMRSRISFDLEQAYVAKSLAYSCANVALDKIRFDSSYVGNESMSFDKGRCEILSVESSAGSYTIKTKGEIGGILSKNRVVVVRTEDPDTLVVTMTVQFWKEVGDF